MATLLKKNSYVAKKEEERKTSEEQFNEERIKFFDDLRQDTRFKQFVIAEILDKEIANLLSLESIPIDGSPTSLMRIVMASKKAASILKQIRSKLV